MSAPSAPEPPLRGLAFPFCVRNGRFVIHAGADKVADDVRHLLSTRPGERLMRRAYGGGVHALLQDPADEASTLLMRYELERAFAEHVPDARLTAPITVSSREQDVVVTVDYVVEPSDIVRRTEVRLT